MDQQPAGLPGKELQGTGFAFLKLESGIWELLEQDSGNNLSP